MAEKLNTEFVRREGKFFSSILSTEPNYVVQNGAVVEDGVKVMTGAKGVFMKVRVSINTPDRASLFSINTEAFNSSR